MEVEFLAWLNRLTVATHGSSDDVAALQTLLLEPESRTEAVLAELRRGLEPQERSHRDRLKPLTHVQRKQSEGEHLPRSLKEAIASVLQRPELVAALLNETSADLLAGHDPLTGLEATQCLETAVTLRCFVGVESICLWDHVLAGKSTNPRKSPSSVDTYQAAYLPLVDVFVTDDGAMRERFEALNAHLDLRKRVIGTADFLQMFSRST